MRAVVLNTASCAWSQPAVSGLPLRPLYGHAAVVLCGEIWVLGGLEADWPVIGSTALDPGTLENAARNVDQAPGGRFIDSSNCSTLGDSCDAVAHGPNMLLWGTSTRTASASHRPGEPPETALHYWDAASTRWQTRPDGGVTVSRRDSGTHARLARWGADALLVQSDGPRLQARGIRLPRLVSQGSGTEPFPCHGAPPVLADAPTELQPCFACVKVGGSLLLSGGQYLVAEERSASKLWLLRPRVCTEHMEN